MDTIQIENLKTLILLAIDEDIREQDITSAAIFPRDHMSRSFIRSKGDGVFCGAFMADYIYAMIDSRVTVTKKADEGEYIKSGRTVLAFEGPTKSILEGERVLLNFLQRMCGIATKTSEIVSLVTGGTIQILDTRKTLPGFRLLDKYAVAAGGGTNHRMGLFDMVMIKDNHIRAAGSITNAVNSVRKKWGKKYTVEVETTDLDEVREALESGADIIMLDNMDRSMTAEALKIIDKRAKVELSGNMDKEKISSLRDLPADYISIGGLTHSVEAFDLSMKFE